MNGAFVERDLLGLGREKEPRKGEGRCRRAIIMMLCVVRRKWQVRIISGITVIGIGLYEFLKFLDSHTPTPQPPPHTEIERRSGTLTAAKIGALFQPLLECGSGCRATESFAVHAK